VESLHWSWSKTRQGLTRKAALGLSVGVVVGAAEAVTGRQAYALANGLAFGLMVALTGILVMLLITGLKASEVATTSTPNQGIRRSARHALRLGGAAGLVGSGAGVLACGLAEYVFQPGYGRLVAVSLGLLNEPAVALLVGLYYGGFTYIQHSVLWYILYRAGAIPWNYANFLDYAAERIFVRKIGGGYLFVHRLLLEYFASVATERTAPPAPL
jgi:hypothetical protein